MSKRKFESDESQEDRLAKKPKLSENSESSSASSEMNIDEPSAYESDEESSSYMNENAMVIDTLDELVTEQDGNEIHHTIAQETVIELTFNNTTLIGDAFDIVIDAVEYGCDLEKLQFTDSKNIVNFISIEETNKIFNTLGLNLDIDLKQVSTLDNMINLSELLKQILIKDTEAYTKFYNYLNGNNNLKVELTNENYEKLKNAALRHNDLKHLVIDAFHPNDEQLNILSNIFNVNENIESFAISGDKLSKEGLKKLAEICVSAKKMDNLEILNLDLRTTENAEIIANLIINCKELKSISLQGSKISPNSMTKILESIKNNNTLYNVDMQDVAMLKTTGEEILNFLIENESITTFDISNKGIGKELFDKIHEQLKLNTNFIKNLVKEEISKVITEEQAKQVFLLNDDAINNTGIITLTDNNKFNNFTDTALNFLFKAVSNYQNLSKIVISNLRKCPSVISKKFLAKKIHHLGLNDLLDVDSISDNDEVSFESLKNLILSKTDECSPFRLSYLNDITLLLSKPLSVNDYENFARSINNKKNLTILSLDDKYFSHNCMLALAENTKNLTSLQQVEVKNVILNDKFCSSLNSLLLRQNNFKNLMLNNCTVKLNNSSEFLNLLKENKNLEYLDLSNTKFYISSEEFFKTIKECKNLKFINLSGSNINPTTREVFLAVTENKNLQINYSNEKSENFSMSFKLLAEAYALKNSMNVNLQGQSNSPQGFRSETLSKASSEIDQQNERK